MQAQAQESSSQSTRQKGILWSRVPVPGFLLILAALPAALILTGALALMGSLIFMGVAPGARTGVTARLPDFGAYGRALPVGAPAAKVLELDRSTARQAGAPLQQAGGSLQRTSSSLQAGGSSKEGVSLFEIASAAELDQMLRKVIKDADISIEVRSFKEASERVTAICEARGGYVQSSSARASKGDFRSGTVVLRVPQDEFEAVLKEIEGVGKVSSKEITGRDVTEEYVDLRARLSNWQQQEKQLLAIMAKASKVSDVLQVQAELGRVREEIERITGRLKYLDSQVVFSTIRVNLFEPSVADGVSYDWGFMRAVRRAVAAFVGTINAIIVFIGGIAPVVLIALAAWAVVAGIRRHRTRGSSQ